MKGSAAKKKCNFECLLVIISSVYIDCISTRAVSTNLVMSLLTISYVQGLANHNQVIYVYSVEL